MEAVVWVEEEAGTVVTTIIMNFAAKEVGGETDGGMEEKIVTITTVAEVEEGTKVGAVGRSNLDIFLDGGTASENNTEEITALNYVRWESTIPTLWPRISFLIEVITWEVCCYVNCQCAQKL